MNSQVLAGNDIVNYGADIVDVVHYGAKFRLRQSALYCDKLSANQISRDTI